jgi:hypothetical protein
MLEANGEKTETRSEGGLIYGISCFAITPGGPKFRAARSDGPHPERPALRSMFSKAVMNFIKLETLF